MGAVAYLGRMRRDLEPALLGRIEAARRADRHRPLTVLVGSNLLGAYLGRTLAEKLGGLFNVRFMTFADLAAALAGAGARRARAAIPPFGERVIVEEMLASADIPPVFRDAAAMSGFAGALLRAFDDLSEAGCGAEEARRIMNDGPAARIDEKTRGTLSLFARHRERVETLGGDLHSVFRDACSGRAGAAAGSRVFAYGFYDFNEMQWRLLERVAGAADVEIFVPWSRDDAYRFAGGTMRRIGGSGIRTVELRSPGAATPETRPELLNMPGEEEEAREIARRILTLARDRGIRFGEVAVVLPSVEGYADLLLEAFEEAGMPYYAASRPLAAGSPAARGALALLAMLGGGIERRELVEFLSSAPLRASAAAAAVDHRSLWIRHSAEAGIVGDRGWLEENEALAARIESAVERGEMPPRAIEAVRGAGAALGIVVGARGVMDEASSWPALSGRFATLLRDLLEPSDDVEETCGIVERLGRLDRLGLGASTDRFIRTARTALEAARSATGRLGGEGVNILSLGEARGLAFEAVFVPGLAERLFPAPARQDPLLGDADRMEINRASGGGIALSRKAERLDEEALLFALALESAAGTLVLSFPRFEQGTGKERLPSSFLRFAGFGGEKAEGAAPAASRISRGTARERGVELLSLHEFDFESARGAPGGAAMPPDNRFFERAARLVRERWGTRAFTPYDGVFTSKRSRDELRRILDERGWRFSPTALERYAGCPFAYLASDILRVEALEEPERIVTITPAQRGILVHGILAALFGELEAAGLLPPRNAPPQRLFAVAEEVTARLLDEFPRTEPVGLPVFWEMEKRLVRESVMLFLEEERIDEGDFVPAHFERPFGRERDRADVPHDRGDRSVFFRGWIDRIDTAPGGRFRVIDYKTGRLTGADQDLGNGTALQLPVYLIAAARLLDRPLENGEALYRRVGAGERRLVRFSGSRWNETREEFSRIIEVTTRGIERGVFFAVPAAACRYCDFGIACTTGASRLFERKAASDRIARDYLEMRGAVEEEP